jgi:23S rRNA pseudouridine1911/1915/1917 synthase
LNQSASIVSGDLGPQDPEEGADLAHDIELRPLLILPAQHGKRLDHALVDLVPEFSRSYLQQLIETGAVHLHGATVTKPSAKVKAGDQGSIELRPTPQSQAFKPEPMLLQIVFQDAHLLVIDKPAGLVVHPAPGNWSGTLLNGLLAFDTTLAFLPRAGIVHRLDKDTSGLMVVARTRQTMDALVKMMAAREVSRQYLAITGKPWVGATPREVNAPVGRDPRNRLRMAVVDLSQYAGKSARTTLTVLESNASATLVQCTLHTGRTHQIRVHMASIGHPLVADQVYGGMPMVGLLRQALHARRLAFTHPETGRALVFESALPQDLVTALANLGLSYNPQ